MGKRADRVHTRCRLIFVACIVRMDVCVGRDVSETVQCCMSVRNRVQRERERETEKKERQKKTKRGREQEGETESGVASNSFQTAKVGPAVPGKRPVSCNLMCRKTI